MLVPPGITTLHSTPTPSRPFPPHGTFRPVGTACELSAVGDPLVTAATVATLMAELAAVHQQLDQVRQSARAALGISDNPQPAGTGRPVSGDAEGGAKPGLPPRPSHSRGKLDDLYPHPSGGFLRDQAESPDLVGSLIDLGEGQRCHVENGKKRGAERDFPVRASKRSRSHHYGSPGRGRADARSNEAPTVERHRPCRTHHFKELGGDRQSPAARRRTATPRSSDHTGGEGPERRSSNCYRHNDGRRRQARDGALYRRSWEPREGRRRWNANRR